LHLVLFAFCAYAVLALFLDNDLGAVLLELFKLHDLRANETSLKIGVDHTCRLGGQHALANGPALDLVLASRKVVDEAKSVIALVHNARNNAARAPIGFDQLFLGICTRQFGVHEFLLVGDAHRKDCVAAAARGNMDAVETWFDRLRQAQFSPNLVVYNTVISGAAKARNLSAAEDWFHRMHREGLAGDVPTYGSLINAAKNSGNLSAATYWYREMIAAGLEPHLMAYCSLISASKDTAAAEHWLHEIQEPD